MAILEFVLRRLLWAVFVLAGIIVVNFILLRLAPGDPAAIMAGQAGATDEQYLAQLRAQFGLDQPLHVQLYSYIRDVAQLDLGVSVRQQVPVAELTGRCWLYMIYWVLLNSFRRGFYDVTTTWQPK